MNFEVVYGLFPVLESETIFLKRIEEKHLDEVFEIYDNENVFTYCGIIPKHNKDTVKKMIGHFERDFLKRARIKWGIFAVQEPDRLLGIIEAFDFNQKVNSLSVGYFLAEQHYGKGIATAALRLLTGFLLDEVNVNRIQAEVMPPNEASKRVLLKNGFTKEGLLRQSAVWSGKGTVDLEIYSLLKVDLVSTEVSEAGPDFNCVQT
ncbi:GNAT family N-acetyltransferase [Paenibacillus sp. KQZ6P-2]|uniref:GNAT family N-acetyltransferase n=1 Tax=Paenibacillus mangrovi TaxID=2931978 RepID=A0A9X1WVH8_9BACL|nr:GNAT family protein [Paenibacillus mangrovi]MCJ8014323.1 GNAT family N-acetyltransferase [Paenibacillus mangrovi]